MSKDKKAVIGVGYEFATSKDKKWGASVGFPHVIAGYRKFGNEDDTWSPAVGIDPLGLHLGVHYNPEAARKKLKGKNKKASAMHKEAVGNLGEEELNFLKKVRMTRDDTRAAAQELFSVSHQSRTRDVALMEKLFVQAPAALTMTHNLLKKEAKIFGTPRPDSLEHAAIPYKTRKNDYTKYLKGKSKEAPTGYLKAMAIGTPLGAALGAFGAMQAPAAGALVGGTMGALVGAAMAATDKGNISGAKKILKSGKINSALADEISTIISSKESFQEWKDDMRHREVMDGIRDKRASVELLKCASEEEVERFEKIKVAFNVHQFFESGGHLDSAQRRFPELVKAAKARPSVTLKKVNSSSASGSTSAGGTTGSTSGASV